MKKILFILVTVAIFLTSCEKKPESQPAKESKETTPIVAEVEKTTEVEKTVEVEKKNDFIPAVMLWESASLWTEKDNNEMHWKTNIDYGTPFDCYPKVSENSTSSITESKEAIRVITSPAKKENKDFTKIKYQGNDCWVQSTIIAVNAVPGVIVKDNTFIYKNSEIDKITNDKLEVGTVVALCLDAPVNGFTKLSARVGDKLYDEVYIKTDKASNKAADVKAFNMIKIIKDTKDKTMQLELLENTKTLNVSEEVNEILSTFEDVLVNGDKPKTIEQKISDVKTTTEEIKEKATNAVTKITESAISQETEKKVEKLEEKAKEAEKIAETVVNKVKPILVDAK